MGVNGVEVTVMGQMAGRQGRVPGHHLSLCSPRGTAAAPSPRPPPDAVTELGVAESETEGGVGLRASVSFLLLVALRFLRFSRDDSAPDDHRKFRDRDRRMTDGGRERNGE